MKIPVRGKFSSFMIGEGTLLIQCAELLLSRGHLIGGIVSSDATVSDWAHKTQIPHQDSSADLTTFLSQEPFDYLFSIVNPMILPAELLALPRRGAINYHDAPLPKYAGSHATSWALMHREATHGVTWHLMSPMIDGGDLLKQRLVDIAADETAFSLNIKCYEAGILSFAELIDDLEHGEAAPHPQDLAERTYFSLRQRPAAGCVISWNRCAHEIDAFVRALDFGPYPNPLGLPKLAVGGEFFLVPALEVLKTHADAPPGTLTGRDPECLQVATASREIVIRQLMSVDGQSLPIAEFISRFGLKAGQRLPEIGEKRARRLTEHNAALCRHEAFWVQRLAALRPVALPFVDRGAESASSPRSVSVRMPIPEEVREFLAAQQGDELEGDFLLAALAVYLARVSGESCFDIGYRDAELLRELSGEESLFASFVPLRVQIDGTQRFPDIVAAVAREAAVVRRHRTYARDMVVRYPLLRSMPGLRRELLFPVSVARASAMGEQGAARGGGVTLFIGEDEAECQWVCDAERVSADDIARMLRQFAILLKGIAADPEHPVASLPLLSEEECRQLLVEWNGARTEHSRDSCIHWLFEEQVERNPDAVAVTFEQEQLTYAQLNARANQVAHHLRKLEVGPEVLVGIGVERSLEMVVGLLGILKAGGAYVPLDLSYPKDHLAFTLADARVSVLVTQESLLHRLPPNGARLVLMDSERASIAAESEENPTSEVRTDNLAYVIYTSGSTGRPKGVCMSHGAAVDHLVAARDAYGLDAHDCVLQFASTSFDVSLEQIFTTLFTGARLVLRGPEIWSPGEFWQRSAQEGITVINLPTAYWQQLSRQGIAVTEQGVSHQMRLVIIGGDMMPPAAVRCWQRTSLGSTRLLNAYGPTEAAITATMFVVPPQFCEDTLPARMPIGCPIGQRALYILDRCGNQVPNGSSGELHIGGPLLARGYLHRPELTAERFIPDAFSGEPGARLYRTGDLARYLPTGDIECLGRLDHQVKVRGFRIELGEIEGVLRQHPAVQQAVVLVREDTPDEKRLVAYLATEQDPAPSAQELRSFLRKKLPEYMVPLAFVMLPALPFTPNGKLDRRALPAPDRARPELPDTHEAPRTPTEERVAAIWAEVLGLDRVGIDDNFFELGGHSLLAFRVISRVRDHFRVELPLRYLYAAPTVAGLAKALETTKDSGRASRMPAIVRVSREQYRATISDEGIRAVTHVARLEYGQRDDE